MVEQSSPGSCWLFPSNQVIQLRRLGAVDRVNPNQGIIAVTGPAGTLSIPEASTLSTS